MINNKMAKKEYSKKKIAITLDEKLLKKIDKIKDFPRWKGNRSKVIEEGMREFINSDIIIKKESICIFCDSKDSDNQGSYWVMVDRKRGIGLCSACALKVMQNPDKLVMSK